MTLDSDTRWLYWRNFFLMLPKGHVAFEQVMRLMGIFLHFKKQTKFLDKAMDDQIKSQMLMPMNMRMVPVLAEAVEVAAPADERIPG